MMKKITFILLITMLILSCESLVEDFKIKSPKDKITLVGYAYADSIPAFYLTPNLALDDPALFPPIENAEVELFMNGETAGMLSLDDSGWFSTNNLTFMPGNNYRINASAAGYPDITADFEVPLIPEASLIDTNLIIEQYPDCPDCGKMYSLEYNISFNNLPEVDEYYSVEVVPAITLIESYYNSTFYMSSNAPYIETTRVNGDDYTNRAAGEEAWGDGFYFSDKTLANGQNTLIFSVELSNMYDVTDGYGLRLIFKKIDENMFEYARSKGRNSNASDNPFVQPVTIYSNIENGLGLVTGSSEIEIITDISEIVDLMNNEYYY
jgi:hypothetical protein